MILTATRAPTDLVEQFGIARFPGVW